MSSESQHSVQISWKFPHPPEILWQAWTDPVMARLWFGSDPAGQVLDANFAVQLNGVFSVTFANADGTEFTCRGIYKEIQPPHKLIFTWGWANQPEVDELITLQFSPDEHGTLMLFEQSQIDPQTALHNYEEGWRSTFQKLEKALEARKRS